MLFLNNVNIIKHIHNRPIVMEKNEEDRIEKRHYLGKKNSDIINIPVLFRRNALSSRTNKSILKAPITFIRILMKVMNDISNDQFVPKKQPAQLKLFDEEFQTDSNTYARFTFKVTDIDKNKDYNSIQKGLDFLENLNKDWYKSKNKKGKPVKTKFGVIISPSITEGKITFLMARHWLVQLLAMENYNEAFFQVAWHLKDVKHFLIYLWVLELNENGTTVNYKTIQNDLDLNYSSVKEFNRNVFKKVKDKLDKIGNVSFNYSTKGELLTVKKIPIIKSKLDLKEKTVTNQKINQRLRYWTDRHQLEKEQTKAIKQAIHKDKSLFKVFQNAYDSIVRASRKNKVSTTTFEKKEFMKLFQKEIEVAYKNSSWGGTKFKEAYPKIC